MADHSDKFASVQPDASLRQSSILRLRGHLRQIAGTLQPRNLRSRFDESDIVQETLISADQSFSNFHGQTRYELLNWLRTILENRFHDLYRHHRRHKRDVRRESTVDGAGKSVKPVSADGNSQPFDTDSLNHAMRQLSPRTQSVIAMKCFEEKSYTEIAAHLGCSHEAVRKIWERGVKDLKELVARQNPDHDETNRSNS